MSLHVGDWVEVRSKSEILSSLDKNGRLDGLPLMPQMLEYCGQRFQIYKSAHKTCDPINGPRGLAIPNCVHLDLRCDGRAYGGCDAECLIFWKEAWLRPVDSHSEIAPGASEHGNPICSEEDVRKAATIIDQTGAEAHRCQAVCLTDFASPLPWWDFSQYLRDYTTGNSSAWTLFCGATYVAYWHLTQSFRHRFGTGAPGRWIYDRFQALRGGTPFPYRLGLVPLGEKTPSEDLNLQPGELVRVKSHQEILKTLSKKNMNNGMSFDVEMVPYCGKVLRVRSRITTFIDERTGHRKSLKTPAVILDDAWCRSCYSPHRMGCPRSIFSWWREIWLERVEEGAEAMDAQLRN